MNLENYLSQKDELKRKLGKSELEVLEKQLCNIFADKGIDTKSDLLRKLCDYVIQTCKVRKLNVLDDELQFVTPDIKKINHVTVKSDDDCTFIYVDGVEIKQISHLNIERNLSENSKITIQFYCKLDSDVI